ncbi:hypothetical protein [Alteromonas confluentis]|uniref:Uncharacterized protein n=1 Tax=Alteromonas confluentis TaxID=1656094 RepID=A0A1E7ZDJ9_9ALTE|nr:hypothetical protein [Alteromonas confluentis]OFC71522.1 hypothetical protein BFC18_07240 [Alteromonas confluentis]
MTTHYNYPSSSASSFWRMPLSYFFICCVINYFTGALDLQTISDARGQRDFNAAVGMPLLTSFFWISLRVQQQQMASAIMSYLLDKNALSLFAQHRARLASKLRQQIITSATLAVSVTVVYIISEELVAFDLNAQVLVLDLIAVPFWFFFWLFLFQMVSSTQYITRHFITKIITTSGELKALRRISSLSVENTLFGLIALVIIPVFWFNTQIPAIDMFIVTIFSLSLIAYLFMPAYRIVGLISTQKQQVIDKLTVGLVAIHKVEQHNKLEAERRHTLEREIEEVENISASPVPFELAKRLISVVMLVPASWMALLYLEHLVG